jgi:hypothetical protein
MATSVRTRMKLRSAAARRMIAAMHPMPVPMAASVDTVEPMAARPLVLGSFEAWTYRRIARKPNEILFSLLCLLFDGDSCSG